jgi:hypothetical protein
LPDRFKISQLTAGLSQALYRATGEGYRRHASGPHQWPPKTRSVHRCGHRRIRRRISSPKYTQ